MLDRFERCHFGNWQSNLKVFAWFGYAASASSTSASQMPSGYSICWSSSSVSLQGVSVEPSFSSFFFFAASSFFFLSPPCQKGKEFVFSWCWKKSWYCDVLWQSHSAAPNQGYDVASAWQLQIWPIRRNLRMPASNAGSWIPWLHWGLTWTMIINTISGFPIRKKISIYRIPYKYRIPHTCAGRYSTWPMHTTTVS